jgi:hypothetical protein
MPSFEASSIRLPSQVGHVVAEDLFSQIEETLQAQVYRMDQFTFSVVSLLEKAKILVVTKLLHTYIKQIIF